MVEYNLFGVTLEVDLSNEFGLLVKAGDRTKYQKFRLAHFLSDAQSGGLEEHKFS